jgi:hypothetical protein
MLWYQTDVLIRAEADGSRKLAWEEEKIRGGE